MSTSEIGVPRKYTINISVNEAIDQLHEQLCQLLNNSQVHFSKRRKILLQLERKNNHFRRSIDQSDLEKQKKLIVNTDVIRRIKHKIIDEDRRQRQQRRHEHEQVVDDNWSLDGLCATIIAAVAGIISVATFIIMMLDSSKENYI
jgi:hypothetical protein